MKLVQDIQVAPDRPAFDERIRISGSDELAVKGIPSATEVQDALIRFFNDHGEDASVDIKKQDCAFTTRCDVTDVLELKERLISVARLLDVLHAHANRPGHAADAAVSGTPLAYRGRKD